MSKSTRWSPDALKRLGMEESEEGKFEKKGNFVWGEDGKPEFKEDPDGRFTVANHPKDFSGYICGVDPVRSDTIELVVSGEPKAQERHRHHKVKGSDFVTTYDPSAKAKKEFLKKCLHSKPPKPFEQPLSVEMVFYFARPKSHYRTGKFANVLKDNAPSFHIIRPDSDNCAKLVKDALNKTFWKDDSLVCDLDIKKRYSDNPRTEIRIVPL